MEDLSPIGLLEARERLDLVVKRIVTPIAAFEICRFPAVRNETLVVTESDSVLSLGLSRTMANAEGRAPWGSRLMPMGGLNFRPAGVPLQFAIGGPPFHTLRARFDDRALAGAGVRAGELGNSQLEACLDIHAPRIEETMMRIAEEVDTPGTDAQRLVDALAEVLLVDLARYLAAAADQPRRGTGGLAPRKLRLVCERMDRPGKPPNLDELAQLCGLSRFHFVRAFRQSTGWSPVAYAQRLRMNRARRMLAADIAIGDVARELGFARTAAFSAAFRRDSGRSPSGWRAGLR